VTVNGAAKPLNALYVGSSAVVSIKNGAVVKAAISSDADISWVQGAAVSSSASSAARYLYVRDLSTGSTTSHIIPSTAVCGREGTTIDPADIKNTDFVTIKKEKGIVTRVEAASASRELSGVISEIQYGTTVTFKITDTAGTKYLFLLDINRLPQILRGSTPISIDRLKAGGTVTVMTERGEVKTIVSTGTETTLTGELTSISTTKNGTTWVITADDGIVSSLVLDENAGAYSGTKTILLSDIKVGDRVSVVVYNNIITEVNLNSSVSSSDKVSGAVLAVDAANKVITILTPSGKLVYINISSLVSIINSATGWSVALSGISTDSQIVAYGAYSDSTHFTAVSIIIE